MKRNYLIVLLSIYCFVTFAQNQYTIKGKIKGVIAKKVFIKPIYGFDNRNIDSAVISNSSFVINLPAKTPVGSYRLDIGKDLRGEFYNEDSKYIDLIFNHENIEFITNINSPYDSIIIVSSEENKLYYDFINKNHVLNVQLGILDQLPEFFPKNDDFYPSIAKQYVKVQKKSAALYNSIFEKKQNTIAAHAAKSLQIPMLDLEWSSENKYQYVKDHFFDNVDFTDTILLKTDVISTKVIDYIKLFRNKQLQPSDQAKDFIKAVDIVLKKAKANDKIFKFTLDYIIQGFEQLEMEEVLIYIADNYIADKSCTDDKTASNLNKRVEGYKNLAIGNNAPEIQVTDDKGNITKLSEVNSEYTLILFYASWCPHCIAILPEIKEIYTGLKKKNPKLLEIIAISLDTTKTDWLNLIVKGQYNWINYSDFKSWDSKIAKDYFVYATPTMILTD